MSLALTSSPANRLIGARAVARSQADTADADEQASSRLRLCRDIQRTCCSLASAPQLANSLELRGAHGAAAAAAPAARAASEVKKRATRQQSIGSVSKSRELEHVANDRTSRCTFGASASTSAKTKTFPTLSAVQTQHQQRRRRANTMMLMATMAIT